MDLVLLSRVAAPLATSAQVVTDATLGRAPVSLPGPEFRIPAELGTPKGPNLFHSFETFRLPHATMSATFQAPVAPPPDAAAITRVIARVTGPEVSDLQGGIRSEIPGADLYLVNPNGIVFGKDARVDIGGAFTATTAHYLRLGDGGRFDATQPPRSFLTTAPPEAFGFGNSTPAPIRVEGTDLGGPGKSLTLVGGDLTVTDRESQPARIERAGATVTFAGMGPNSEFALTDVSTPTAARARPLAADGTVSVLNGATVDTTSMSAGPSGTVFIRGGRIVVDAATIANDTTTDDTGARTTLDAGGQLLIRNAATVQSRSRQVAGPGGTLELHGDQVSIESGHFGAARIAADTRNGTVGTRVRIHGREVSIRSGAVSVSTQPGTQSGQEGAELEVEAERFEMALLGQIFADNGSPDSRPGSEPKVRIAAVEATLTGGSQIVAGNRPDSFGKGADVSISGRNLRIEDGARIIVDTFGHGHAGTAVLTSDQLSLRDGGQVSAVARPGAEGSAGKIEIGSSAVPTKVLEILGNGDGSTGLIADSRSEASTARSGSISVATGNVAVAGGVIQARTINGFTDDISVEATTISVTDGSYLGSASSGTGRASDIQLFATESLRIDRSRVETSAERASAGILALGAPNGRTAIDISSSEILASGLRGGDVVLMGEAIHLTESTVSAAAIQGEPGDTDGLVLLVGPGSNDPSRPQPASSVVLNRAYLNASAERGAGGSVTIVADAYVASADSTINVTSTFGAPGTESTPSLIFAPPSEPPAIQSAASAPPTWQTPKPWQLQDPEGYAPLGGATDRRPGQRLRLRIEP
jgi:filamentous hemagglutinin family protein